jgi:hypothetical protein
MMLYNVYRPVLANGFEKPTAELLIATMAFLLLELDLPQATLELFFPATGDLAYPLKAVEEHTTRVKVAMGG